MQKDEIDAINALKNSKEYQSMKELYGTAAWDMGKKSLLSNGNKYSVFVSKWAEKAMNTGEIDIDPASEERILHALQNFIDNQFNLNFDVKTQKEQPKTGESNPLQRMLAARKISKDVAQTPPQAGRTKSSIYDPNSGNEDFHFLASSQRWIDLIKHPDFETEKLPQRYYDSLAGMVARWHQNSWIDKQEHDFLISRIRKAAMR